MQDKGDQFEVVGKSYVAVYDGKFLSREGSGVTEARNAKLFLENLCL